jgi:hypothetical protein
VELVVALGILVEELVLAGALVEVGYKVEVLVLVAMVEELALDILVEAEALAEA